jgi:hypothetical protein
MVSVDDPISYRSPPCAIVMAVSATGSPEGSVFLSKHVLYTKRSSVSNTISIGQ